MQRIAKYAPEIKIEIGEKGALKPCHILITTPNYISANLTGRAKLNLSKLKMLIYDEADELFIQAGNKDALRMLRDNVTKGKPDIQQLLFSATFNEEFEKAIGEFIQEMKGFKIPRQALKLAGVK